MSNEENAGCLGVFLGGNEILNHSGKFPPLVETAAAKLLRQMQQQNLADVILGGLGIPSDLECICDAGTLGKWYSRASETFEYALIKEIHLN